MWNPPYQLQWATNKQTYTDNRNEAGYSPETSRHSHWHWWNTPTWQKHCTSHLNHEQTCWLIQLQPIHPTRPSYLLQIPIVLQIPSPYPKLPLHNPPTQRNAESCTKTHLDTSKTKRWHKFCQSSHCQTQGCPTTILWRPFSTRPGNTIKITLLLLGT